MTTEGMDDYAAAKAEAARVDAEARRRRILEKSNLRLGIVSGEVPITAVTSSASSTDATPATGTTTTTTTTTTIEEEAAETSTAGTGEEDAVAAASAAAGKSASTAARMQAMRKRRFKKSEAAAPAPVAAATTDEASTAVTSENVTVVASNNVIADEVPEAAIATTTREVEDSDATTATTDATVAETISTTTTTASVEEDADVGAKKKYLGVAKMRRQMIKKKNEQEQLAAQVESKSSAKSAIAGATTATSTLPASRSKLSRAAVLVPVLLHLFTILLLFGAGLQVGLQQGHYHFLDDATTVDVVSPVVIHNEWGPRHRGLLSWIEGNSNSGLAAAFGKTKIGAASSSIRRDIVIDDKVEIEKPTQSKNKKRQQGKNDNNAKSSEFEEQILATDDETKNIDPIFRVDLDQMTRGPGILMQLARGAVAIHRIFLTVFLLTPQRFLLQVWRLPYNLWMTPPVLCGLALFIRQIIAKMILGQHQKLPNVQQQHEPKNLVTMILQTGITFLSNTFPTLVKLYEGWCHLRSDLYIVLCGLFVGMAWIYNSASGGGTSRLVTRDDEL